MRRRAYSQDLREKVIKYIERGNSQRATSKTFQISKNTVNRWHVRYKREGHYEARINRGSKARIEKDKFIKYVEENTNMRAEDIGKEFGMSGSGARYWLRQLGFSYKKKPLPMWKLIKRREVII